MGWRLRKLPWTAIGIVMLAAALRLVLLDIKPPHFDEGVNGWFVDQMTHTGYYRYDPQNYHGPLHFYAAFLSETLLGRNLWALRIPAVLASVLAVVMLLKFDLFFGSFASRLAALAMAASPAFVFYGRYSIHESWQVLFNILFLWSFLGLCERGERRFLFAAFLAAAGMVLTKETYIVHLGGFALGLAVYFAWNLLLPSRPAWRWTRPRWTRRDLTVAAVAAVLLIVFFYSGTFLDFPALSGLLTTFATWFATGSDAAGHAKSAYEWAGINFYWVCLMARYEWPALLGLICCLRFVAPSDGRARLIAIVGGGTLLAYSLIPYKTPWCVISLLWPFYLTLAVAAREALETLRPAWPGAVPSRAQPFVTWGVRALLAVVLFISAGLCVRLNFFSFTDEKEPYVYVQTFPEIRTLTQPLLESAAADPRMFHVRGQILLESYFPIPWILGEFTRVGYYKPADHPPEYDGDFIVAASEEAPKIEAQLTEPYYRRSFRLRDSQGECVAFFRALTYRSWFENAPPEIPGKPSS